MDVNDPSGVIDFMETDIALYLTVFEQLGNKVTLNLCVSSGDLYSQEEKITETSSETVDADHLRKLQAQGRSQ